MRWLNHVVVFALVAIPSAGSANAQQQINCKNWQNLPQQGMNICAGQFYEAADTELNQVWSQIRGLRGNGTAWTPLLEAQRAWIPFRDAHCASVAAPYEGGSIQPLVRLTCLTDTTEQRTAQLREFLTEP